MTSATICILIAIVVYLVLMLYIGVRFAKKNNNADDFYLGGRKLGPLVTAMSAEASDMSSYLLMGLPDNVQPEVKISEHLTSFRGDLMDKIERYPGYFTIDSVSV